MNLVYKIHKRNAGLSYDIAEGRKILDTANITINKIPIKIRNIDVSFDPLVLYDIKKVFLETYRVPDGIREIGPEAFSELNVKTIIIPPSVKQIYEYAFRNSTVEIVIFEDGPEDLFVHNCSFLDCKNLKTLKLPARLTKISGSSFEGCENLSEIEILDSEYVFINDYFSKSNGIYDDWSRLVLGCKGTKLDFSFCEEIEMNAFVSTNKSFVIPKNIIRIRVEAFRKCKMLEEVKIEGTDSIETRCFFGCENLKKVIINQDVKKIEVDSFSICDNLEEIYANSIQCAISPYAFQRSTKKIKIYVKKDLDLAIKKNERLIESGWVEFLRLP